MAPHLTIKQIASLAGVSVGTVDRVLHNRGRVSPEAMAAVQAVLEKQSYKYNLHTSAVALRKSKKSFWIVVAIPSSPKGEYWDLIRNGLEKAFQEYSDISIRSQYVFFDQFNSLSCREAFRSIASLQCSAVILGTTFVEETRELCETLTSRHIPYVFVDGKVPGTAPLASFMVDQQSCGRLLAHLMDGLSPAESEIAIFLPRRVGTQMSNNSTIRLEAFKAYFIEKGRGGYLKERQFSADNPTAISVEVSRFLRENPRVKGIAVVTSIGYQISDAVSASGLGKLCIGGFDVTDGNARCVREGSLDFLINQHPDKQGFNAVESILHYLLYGVPDNTLPEYLPIDIVFRENLGP
jgi:LacI family transcriptional regulator